MLNKIDCFYENSSRKSEYLSVSSDYKVYVTLTAYNDQEAIPLAVKEFVSQKNVVKVIVIDNNSHDETAERARKAGAVVIHEEKQGYGHACIRGLREALSFDDANVIVLAEGDMTFCARDISKLLPYIPDVDMVLGTRTHMPLVSSDAQMDWFLLWGNLFLGKLIQMKFFNGRFLGRVRLTDAGCTMKAIRREALERIINNLSVGGDYFSPHMIMVALKKGLRVIEVPVNFRRRVGISKGASQNRRRALGIGLKMIWHILTF